MSIKNFKVKNGLTVEDEITSGGNVNGRDLAADGTKLDAIASGATNYSNSDVDTHLNTSTATTDQVLSYNGSDYSWVDQSAGGGEINELDGGAANTTYSASVTTLDGGGAS